MQTKFQALMDLIGKTNDDLPENLIKAMLALPSVGTLPAAGGRMVRRCRMPQIERASESSIWPDD